LLPGLVDRNADTYLAYRGVYLLWCCHYAAVQELRPLLAMDGIEPGGRLSVTEEFRAQALTLAKQI
jgi:hypothetical protein